VHLPFHTGIYLLTPIVEHLQSEMRGHSCIHAYITYIYTSTHTHTHTHTHIKAHINAYIRARVSKYSCA
jgi:surface polysaccharide O-acyltransferase-like enzyme